ncbi:MAG TPA: 2-phospho-L-lactate transferase [Ktedonobacterales bacterium]|nr:2-phospho-L-lactate transferase [Ktedonobacterales bacterium]
MIVALAGGVGGAKLAHGLYRTLAREPERLAVVVNTGDDFELYGLRISPDADTVLYTLAGIANPETGWGIAGDSFAALEMLRRYGDAAWFRLGDRDLATHLRRTELLRAGRRPTEVLAALAAALGVRARLLPMADEPVATVVTTPDGELAFQDYFVRRGHRDPVSGVRFVGIERARPTAEALAALAAAEAVIFCPSNPIVSIGPILAVPGMRALVRAAPGPRVAVSPIVAGRALKGPADAMLAALGHESSAYAVAALYHDLLDGMVIDRQDAEQAARIEALGMRVLVTDTIMRDEEERRRLAADVLHFAGELRPARQSMEPPT